LKGNIVPSSLQSTQSSNTADWALLKKSMSKFDFKNWFIHLNTNVDSIDIQDVYRVEHIIRLDPTITYERLRDVSQIGYKLLIVVAACLQYVKIYTELEAKKRELDTFNYKLVKSNKFLQIVSTKSSSLLSSNNSIIIR
jgi:hypothetical protein